MKTILFTILAFFFISTANANSAWLWIQNPQNWNSGEGVIKEASLSVRPRGVYMEYDLYLTFGVADPKRFGKDTQLEILYNFNLPHGSIIHDSWLWVGKDIVQAKIMSRWSAQAIYESIVDRRKDPSVLYKNGTNSYEMHIYPLKPSETRKVKITYLVPVIWGENLIAAPLPSDLLLSSYIKRPDLNLKVFKTQEWTEPTIAEFSDIVFEDKFNETLGYYSEAVVPEKQLIFNSHIAFNKPNSTGFYSNYFPTQSGKGYYQLVVEPEKVLNMPKNQNVLFLVDLIQEYKDIEIGDIIKALKGAFKINLSAKDKFNLFLSYHGQIYKGGDGWLDATVDNLEKVVENLTNNFSLEKKTMEDLIAEGMEFINDNSSGKLVLISDNYNYDQNNRQSNNLYDGAKKRVIQPVDINVLDISQMNGYYYNYNYNWDMYSVNSQFLSNIARISEGNYISVKNVSEFGSSFSNLIQSLSTEIKSYDLYTTLTDGICYGRIDVGGDMPSSYMKKPFKQIGEYKGNFPLLVDFTADVKNELVNIKKEVQQNSVFLADSLLEEIWVGNYINSIEAGNHSNDFIRDIIEISVENRVLSRYTAFLCLEPSDSISICKDCVDESKGSGDYTDEEPRYNDGGDGDWAVDPGMSTGIETNKGAANISTTIYPNPFKEKVYIEIDLGADSSIDILDIVIYNIIGQPVKMFNVNEFDALLTLEWDGTDDSGNLVPKGVYFVKVHVGDEVLTYKIIKQ